ncbi:MAG: response regulator [Geothrix sp.]|uniref:response regulator n=1 Tax=Geothrix sp. TaxID=1962974 RepID=UPI001790C700|nr:response regulator [Geothrix sp.]NWJ39927.1 response regulator [Geothrix sp.]WIL22061.1 MAG: response regulator [Geothrix sp.]
MRIDLKKILLVEDNPHDAELTLEALGERNLANEVIWLKDGQEALDFLYCRDAYAGRDPVNPVLVLLDIKMPRVDGLEVLRIVKSDPRLHTIPMVILTSSREETDLIESYNHGVNAFVVKPVNFADFVHAVSSLGAFWAVVNEAPPIRL